MTEYDNTNKGMLWTSDGQKIFKQGTININGDKQNCLISLRKGKDGKDIYELYNRLGFFCNSNIFFLNGSFIVPSNNNSSPVSK